MMSLLLYREVLRPRWSPEYRALPITQPRDVWMGVFSGEERVGFLNMRAAPKQKDDIRGTNLHILAKLNLPLFGRTADLTIQGDAFRENVSGNAEFDATMRSGDQAFRAEGTLKDGELDARVHVADTVTPFKYNVGKQLLLSGGTSGFDLPPLHPGEEIYMDAFNPVTMKLEKARIACTGQETLTITGEPVITNVLETELGAIKTKAWVDENQEVVKVNTPFGFTMQKIDPKEAYAPAAPAEQADFVKNLAVHVEGTLPERGVKHLKIRISGIAPEAMPPADALQSRDGDGDVYDIRMANAPTAEGTTLTDDERNAMLASDPMVNAAHPDIQKMAKEIVSESTAPWERAQKIYAWVYKNIEKMSMLSVPAALEVLRTKQGDCNEHTVLFTALARAADVPARMAIGLVYSEDLGGFGYHAWPEVYAGQWLPMDPTLGQEIADATHIKLLNGGIGEWSRLIAYIGQAKIEVLSVE